MTIDLYCFPSAGTTRAITMTAKFVGVNLNLISVDLQKKEHLTPEFLKMNPQHTVPTIDDNGFYLWESRAIVTYLVENYAKDDSLYPKDPKKRALVNQRIYFDGLVLYQRYTDVYYPRFFKQPVPEEKIPKLDEAFEFLNTFLSGSNAFVAGDHLTIADICLVATVTTADAVGYDISRYPKVIQWLEKCKSAIPHYEETNGKGVEEFRKVIATFLKE